MRQATKNAARVASTNGATNKGNPDSRPVLRSLPQAATMSKQGKIRISRDLVYSITELAEMLGCSEADARNRCAAGLVRGAFKSSDGMMSRWWVFKPMYDEARSTTTTDAEALADRVVGALREALERLRVTVALTEDGR